LATRSYTRGTLGAAAVGFGEEAFAGAAGVGHDLDQFVILYEFDRRRGVQHYGLVGAGGVSPGEPCQRSP
jgi:hypothetical protein